MSIDIFNVESEPAGSWWYETIEQHRAEMGDEFADADMQVVFDDWAAKNSRELREGVTEFFALREQDINGKNW